MTSAQSLQRLRERVQFLIDHARMQHPLGVVGYTPAAFGEGYKALYLRDFTYMAESAPEFVPAEHVQKILALFVAKMSPAGLCPERISNEGEVIYICHGGKPAADCSMFLVKLADAYAKNGGDLKFVESIFPSLGRTLATVPIDPATGLVYIDPAAPYTAYGFTDTIAITGQHFFCSLLLFEACMILSRLAKQLERRDDAQRYEKQAAGIRAQLDQLWSADDRLFSAGSQDCRQADVWGSAYACAIGALDEPRKKEVARSLWEKKDRFLLRGQVRHLLTPQTWNRLIVKADWTAPGQFQNGAYWGTASGWMAEAFEVQQKGAGIALLSALTADFDAHGVWECIGPKGYERVANNVSSACLPYASFKRLLK